MARRMVNEMTKVIVCGHGGYAEGIKKNLSMLLGETEGFFYIDFYPEEDLSDYEARLDQVIKECGGEQILFACDIAGGSPFRTAAVKSAENPAYCTIAGINTSAYSEMVYNTDMDAKKLALLAADITRETIQIFPCEE